jgi:hypothetical protein
MSSHPSNDVTINAAFLQEIKEVNQELWVLMDDLRNLCAHPISVWRHSRHLVDLLAKMRDHLAMHFALEEAYGYFHDPAEPDPVISAHAFHLRGQHSQLYSQCSQLADHAENLYRERDDASLTTVLPVLIDEFLHVLMTHESDETELIYRAMYEDIGAAD